MLFYSADNLTAYFYIFCDIEFINSHQRIVSGGDYLNENKKRLHYRGGGGIGKPKKAKKTELHNFAAQEEQNLCECDKFKIKFMQLFNESHTAHPNDWKEILLKYIEEFEGTKAQDKILEMTQDKILKI